MRPLALLPADVICGFCQHFSQIAQSLLPGFAAFCQDPHGLIIVVKQIHEFFLLLAPGEHGHIFGQFPGKGVYTLKVHNAFTQALGVIVEKIIFFISAYFKNII